MKQSRDDDIEIVSICDESSGGRSEPLTRISRRAELGSETLRLRHVASGIEKEFHLGPTHLSRGEMAEVAYSLEEQFRGDLRRDGFL